MNKYTLFIPGKPFAKQRHRSTRKGIMYTPKQTVDYENVIANEFIKKYGNHEIEAQGYRVDVYCCFMPPKSASKRKHEQMLSGEILHIKKPDKDNLAKIIGDGLNHIAWHDDSKIVMGETIKFYREYQGVYLVITPIDKMDKNLLEWIDEQVEKEEK